MPGSTRTPSVRPSSTHSGSASTESWSVTAMTSTPACSARRISSLGGVRPSEQVVWVWRSTIMKRKIPGPSRDRGFSGSSRGLLHLLEELGRLLGIDGVLALRPVGRADLAGLRRLLGRVERPQDLVHVAADVEEVHRLALDDAVRVDQEHAAERDALGLVEHAVVAG